MGEFTFEQCNKFKRDRFGRCIVDSDTIISCSFEKAAPVFNCIVFRFSFGNHFQGMNQMSSVIGMGRGTGTDFANQITGGNRIGIGAADTDRAFWRNSAGSHVTYSTADAFTAESAGITRFFGPLPNGSHLRFIRLRAKRTGTGI
jgi:hypothetical protein